MPTQSTKSTARRKEDAMKGKRRYQKKYKGIMIDLTAPTADELEEKVRRRKNEIDAGLVAGADVPMTVLAWSKRWMSIYKKPNLDKKSYDTYDANLRLHILPKIGHKKITDVKPADLQEILNEHGSESKSHVGHIKNAMTGMFRDARRNGYITRDPALGLKIPDSATVKGHRALTDEEAKYFLRACSESAYGAVFLIEYYAGLRPVEIIKLRRGNIDDNYIHITETKNTKKKAKPAGIRNVPIVDDLKPAIREAIKGKKPEDLLFTTSEGKPLTTAYLAHRFEAIVRWMNIEAGAEVENRKIIKPVIDEDLTQYDLRHTFCTNLERAGVPINVARQLMGHESIEMTARIYTHKSADVIDAALASLNQFNAKKAAAATAPKST